MADGTTKPIEQIQIGDWVMAEDPETGERGPRQVTAVIVGQGEKELVEIEIDGHLIIATDEHPFWVASRGEWIDAEDLKVGDELLTDDGQRSDVDRLATYTISFQTVYNLTIEGLHTYYVLAGDQPVLVHNSNNPREGIYQFPDGTNGGLPYVGQSGDIERRLEEHRRRGRLSRDYEAHVTEVLRGRTEREIAEYRRIRELTGGVPASQSPNVANQRDPIGPCRRHLLNRR